MAKKNRKKKITKNKTTNPQSSRWWGKRIIMGTTITIILTVFGLYSGGKEIILDLMGLNKPIPKYWRCEQDNNIRGIILSEAYSDPKRVGPLNIRTGGEIFGIRGGIILNYEGSQSIDGYFC